MKMEDLQLNESAFHQILLSKLYLSKWVKEIKYKVDDENKGLT